MNQIAVQCPSCRSTQDLPPLCLLVEVGTGDTDTDSTATWICRACQQLVGLPIDLTSLLRLMAAGVPLLATEPDDVAAYPETTTPGRPFTFDDLLDFHESLQDDESLAELIGDIDTCRGC